MTPLRVVAGPVPSYNEQLVASLELIAAAQMLAHAIVGIRSYKRPDRLVHQGRIAQMLANLVAGLDAAGISSVALAMAPVLGADVADVHLRAAIRSNVPVSAEEAFRGL